MFNNSQKKFSEFRLIMELSGPEMSWYGIWKYLSNWHDCPEREQAVAIANDYFEQHRKILNLGANGDRWQRCKSLLFFCEEVIPSPELKSWLPDILAAFLFYEDYSENYSDEIEISEFHKRLEVVLQKCASPSLFKEALETFEFRFEANTEEQAEFVENSAGFGEITDDGFMETFLDFPELDISAFALATLLWSIDEDGGITDEVINFCFEKTNLDLIQICRSLLYLDYNGDTPRQETQSVGTSLCLSIEKLEYLPAEIGQFTNLKRLSLINMEELKDLPSELANLVNLEELSISGCGFKELPEPVFELTNLKKLTLQSESYHNKTFVISSKIGKLKQLRELEISGSNIHYLPDSMGNLLALEKLHIQCFNLEYLPDSLDNLNYLKDFLLYDYRRVMLPQKFSRVPPSQWKTEWIEEETNPKDREQLRVLMQQINSEKNA